MNQLRFFVGDECDSIVEVFSGHSDVHLTCNGKELKEITANTSEGASEKHLPVAEQNGSIVTVCVGSIAHPMSQEHSIGFVCLETEKGYQRVCLKADQEPKASFALTDGDRPIAAYAYCNLHGLWKTEI